MLTRKDWIETLGALAIFSVAIAIAANYSRLVGLLGSVFFKSLLEVSSLFLGIVNGLILLWMFLRDRPKLVLKPIGPENLYQHFFKLPGRIREGRPTRRYGFLVYMKVTNRGRQDVAMEEWKLLVKAPAKWHELDPLNIPQPRVMLPGETDVKFFPVLGQAGLLDDGDTMVIAGDSLNRMAYYRLEIYDVSDNTWDPLIEQGTVRARFVVTNAFGKDVESKVELTEVPLAQVQEMVPGIEGL